MIKAMDRWLLPWLKDSLRRPKVPITDVMLAVCDHFEPFHHTDQAGAMRRMETWQASLPKILATGVDHDGQTPRHTFFYPVEQYDRKVIEALAELCVSSRNEAEIHLHHDKDTAENFCAALERGKTDLRSHGLLGSDATGAPVFGFIHGNWALDDSDPSGHGCGVRGELAMLKQAGCYADLTMPSAPHRTQAPIVNRLYYSQSTLHGCSHHRGTRVSALDGSTRALREKEDHLLLVQGPLMLDWERRKWGVMPRVENSDLGPANPPTVRRLRHWRNARISVQGAEGWGFIKLHTHGAPEKNHESVIGDARRRFHEELLELAASEGFRLHYVSARELVNILHAAEDGHGGGDAGAWRDYLYAPPPCLNKF
ncbi:hypothetical protein [Prosthecobacter sp.]|uniref:hypothetical protein n=1 Tax=Prosthecobacter sp. TaxID=1965333 RepID=UPI0037832B49